MNNGNISSDITFKTKTDVAIYSGLQWIQSKNDTPFESIEFKMANKSVSANIALSYMLKLGYLERVKRGTYKRLKGFYINPTFDKIKEMMGDAVTNYQKDNKVKFIDQSELDKQPEWQLITTPQMQLDEAIRICKLHGLRVSKKVEQWQEL